MVVPFKHYVKYGTILAENGIASISQGRGKGVMLNIESFRPPQCSLELDTPRPLHTTTIGVPADGEVGTVIVRLWARQDQLACHLCLQCTAQPGPRGVGRDGRPCRVMVCVHGVIGDVAPESAPLFSPDGL